MCFGFYSLTAKDGDLSSLSSSAQALMQLQNTFGLFPRLTGKGDKAKILADMLLRMRQESIIDSRTALYGVGQSHSVDSLIIIDREVDFITPLLTQLTYEGLIDEKFRIRNSTYSILPLADIDSISRTRHLYCCSTEHRSFCIFFR